MNQLTKYFKSNIRQNGMVIALVAIMLLFQLLTNGILFRPMNVNNLVLQNAYVLILATGMLLCILTGNIDLSVGSVVAFVGAVASVMMVDWGVPVAFTIPAALIIGVLIGAFHGYFIAFWQIPAFIVTLAGMLIWRGLTMVILKGQTKSPFDKSFQALAAGYLPGREIRIGSFNTIALVFGMILSVILVFMLLNARKKKQKYGFEVLPRWDRDIQNCVSGGGHQSSHLQPGRLQRDSHRSHTAALPRLSLYLYYSADHIRAPCLRLGRQ
jgi:putative multiple sugar transport system permease protein